MANRSPGGAVPGRGVAWEEARSTRMQGVLLELSALLSHTCTITLPHAYTVLHTHTCTLRGEVLCPSGTVTLTKFPRARGRKGLCVCSVEQGAKFVFYDLITVQSSGSSKSSWTRASTRICHALETRKSVAEARGSRQHFPSPRCALLRAATPRAATAAALRGEHPRRRPTDSAPTASPEYVCCPR